MKLRVRKSGIEEFLNITHYLESEDGETLVAECHFAGADNKANAERLALAWNCHDELLAACELALEQLQHCDCSNGVTTPMGDRDEGNHWAVRTNEQLRAAIAKARGEKPKEG